MPGVLSDFAYIVRVMIWLMIAGWYGWLVVYGLLNVDFEVCLVIISRAFFLAVFPMVPSVFIQSLFNSGSFGGFGISTGWWFLGW
jgi:hypothetical protein